MKVKSKIMNHNEPKREIMKMEKRNLTYSKQLKNLESVFSTVYRIDKFTGNAESKAIICSSLHHVKCNNDWIPQCVDLAAKSKLFSIIVDKLEIVKEILDVNKIFRGTIITIYPLGSINQVYSHHKSQVTNNKIKMISE